MARRGSRGHRARRHAVEYHDGFLHTVHLRAPEFVALGPRLARHPIHTLRVLVLPVELPGLEGIGDPVFVHPTLGPGIVVLVEPERFCVRFSSGDPEMVARGRDGKLATRITAVTMSNGILFEDQHRALAIQKLLLNRVLGPVLSRMSTEWTFRGQFGCGDVKTRGHRAHRQRRIVQVRDDVGADRRPL